MKKCPKCGTILDDSKKKCYMCGMELSSNKNRFGNGLSFNGDVGATVTKNQDNVFNNGQDIKVKGNDLLKKNNDNAFFSQNSSSKDYFGTEINKLNSMSYDERSGFKKSLDNIFASKKSFKSKNELHKEKDIKKTKVVNESGEVGTKITYSTQPSKTNESKKNEKSVLKKASKFDFGFTKEKKNIFSREEQHNNREKFSFNQNTNSVKKSNLGNNQLSNTQKSAKANVSNKVKGYSSGDNTFSSSDNKRMITNLVCIIIFVGMMLFVYFNFLKPKDNNDLSGLVYEMDSEFKLTSKDSFSRYYTYNKNCAIRINYGATDEKSFVDNYLNNIKETYEKDKNTTIQYEELNVNDNIWTSMSVIYLPEPSTSTTVGITPKVRYRYTAIVEGGNFYTIIFVNPKEEQTCYDKYDSFVDSLKFVGKE